MKKLTTILVGILSMVFLHAQVGIDTDNPNGASILDIVSQEKGVMIPRMSSAQRDANLADNDIGTVPPVGIANLALEPGLLIFNSTENAFQYWDGVLWRQVFVNTSTQAGNQGAVKVNAQNGDPNNKPSLTLVGSGNSYGAEKEVKYNYDLVFAPSPTTNWPENETNQSSASIYTDYNNNGDFRWKENPVPGQVHLWRVIAKASAGANSNGSVLGILRNPDSGFEVNSIAFVPSGTASTPKILTFYFYSIADFESIGPGKGYKILMQADVGVSLTIDSLTRISLFKD
ncbi:MAG: hypothetical protein Q4G27_09210 [Flavobacteriaceae bacterium]|nr:hypothetical protein [Flavobacteriaceae bacterium]